LHLILTFVFDGLRDRKVNGHWTAMFHKNDPARFAAIPAKRKLGSAIISLLMLVRRENHAALLAWGALAHQLGVSRGCGQQRPEEILSWLECAQLVRVERAGTREAPLTKH
jgi:hypothetical protein